MKNVYILWLALLLITAQLNAQSIKNVKASSVGSNVFITYDLTSADEGQQFDVELKSSKDGFSNVLKEVTGDVGTNQVAGANKKITWDARKEIGQFIGDISFEITATVTFTPLKFVTPTIGSGIKIGKPYTVAWKGGNLEKNLSLELLKDNNSVIDLGKIDNTGTFTWNVPKTMEKGENFRFKLVDPKKANDAVLSASFKLKKTPILIYVGAGAVVAGVAAVVLLGGGNKTVAPTAAETTTIPDLPANVNPGG